MKYDQLEKANVNSPIPGVVEFTSIYGTKQSRRVASIEGFKPIPIRLRSNFDVTIGERRSSMLPTGRVMREWEGVEVTLSDKHTYTLNVPYLTFLETLTKAVKDEQACK